MAKNIKNVRVLLAILSTAGITMFWNACSEVGFGTLPGQTVGKVEGYEVVPPPPGGDNLPPGGGGGGDGGDIEDSQNDPDNGANACNINVADILVHAERFFPQGDHDAGLEAQPEAGSILISLKKLRLKALANAKSNAIRMVVKESGHFAVDASGNLHPIGTFNGSQTNDNSGVKIRLNKTYEVVKDQVYRVEIVNLQSLLRAHPSKGCVLDNNSDQDGSLAAQ